MSFILIFMTLALTACISSNQDESVVTISSSEQVSSSSFTIDPSECVKYDRDLYKHWVDADGDCQDIRQEVLNAFNDLGESDDCEITEGEWFGPYTHETFTDPSLLHIDHLVPLAEAHRSGAYAWTEEQRMFFANDLDTNNIFEKPLYTSINLIPVEASMNLSKGDSDPSEWHPEKYRQYVRNWARVKIRYGLTADSAEIRAMKEIIDVDTLDFEWGELIQAEEVECTGSLNTEPFDEQCGSKKTCAEMASCEEAKFYLNQCGVSSLDGDGDGTPCESICG